MFGLPFEQIIFLVLAGVSVIFSLGLVIFKDPVHCALSLVLAFFNFAGIYILLGAEFIAAIQVLVYGGAILVLFLFVMMLLQVRPGPALNPFRFFQSKLAPVIAVAFVAEVLLVVLSSNYFINGGKVTDANNTQAANMARNLTYVVTTKVPMTDANGVSIAKPDAWGGEPNTVGHTALLGKELYTTYLFPFEVASLILLVAAIGAIVISRRSLANDPGEGRRRGISLAGIPAPGSPAAIEEEKERQLLLKK